ncbi:hypothetical protein SPRG_09983 [Saprolegnia parasitica CBS 223.65]|uniref:Uncharacterized protein n=1 Tax=Saprolegnia parasitica (strain CBS 223.65) TaxID=695850 RepID=A0A067C257_SAPPC|nr:hypothetical protein SPRG_09983 [Saprolegnia parasitica CBS 223.65]KDO23175.1 hypothetical protein SPRG_09983 [Saprolegnia parasitica CBS 223.65]|eukprot:XP_012206127.1 hypothetical protein SPRG_09983 [Saprolegnia parasitica CBS 223.65]
MFSVNEQLTGVKFTYNGNPHDFGKVTTKYVHTAGFQPPLPPPLPPDRRRRCPRGRRRHSRAPAKPKSPQLFAPFTFDASDIMAVV